MTDVCFLLQVSIPGTKVAAGRDTDTWERIDIYLTLPECTSNVRACCVRQKDRLMRYSDLGQQLRAVRDHDRHESGK